MDLNIIAEMARKQQEKEQKEKEQRQDLGYARSSSASTGFDEEHDQLLSTMANPTLYLLAKAGKDGGNGSTAATTGVGSGVGAVPASVPTAAMRAIAREVRQTDSRSY